MLPKVVVVAVVAVAASYLLASFFVASPKRVLAVISSCSASVSPTTVNTSTSQQYTFTLTSVSGVLWVKVTRPSSNFTITSASGSGWNTQVTGSTATFTPIGQSAGSATITVTATSGSSEASSANWTVQVSDDVNGASPTTCSGSLGTAISGTAPDTTGPSISDIVVSDVTSTSVKITWTTNEVSDSVVDYGTTDAYGSTKSDSASVTSHSLTLDSLTANTTYNYNLKSKDAAGNTGESGNNTFVAAKASSTATTTVTVTTTTTVTKDQSPAVTLALDTSKSFKDAPLISGTAVDDKGVDSLEYSIDGGTTWVRVADVANLGSKQVTFSFAPKGLRDGKRTVKARAKDTAGNTSLSNEITLTIDQKPPAVTLDTDLSHAYPASPTITGTATDPSGEATVEYSLDNGKNWLPVDQIQITDVKTVTFLFTPRPLDDGNYPLQIRATDPVGNSGVSDLGQLIIDRLPPIIGGALFSVGSQILASSESVLITQENMEQKITFSAAGGPTSIELTAIPLASQGEALQTFPAVKNPDSGLWSATLRFSKAGLYSLSAHAIDGAANETTRELNSIFVVDNGRVTDGIKPLTNAVVSLYYLEPTTRTFTLWNGTPYSQQNPQKVYSEGKYVLFVPPGKYYLAIQADGYETLTTGIFTIDTHLPITNNFTLVRKPSLRLGPWRLSLPNIAKFFRSESDLITIKAPEIPQDRKTEQSLLGKEIPFVTIQSAQGEEIVTTRFLGKPTILTFLTSWFPAVSEQLDILEETTNTKEINVVPILLQETPSTAAVFQKRGGYELAFFADRDGILIEPFAITSLPTHIFLDRRGTVKEVKLGVLSKDELLNNVVN